MRYYREQWDRVASQVWGSASDKAVVASGIPPATKVWIMVVVALVVVTWILDHISPSLRWIVGAVWGLSLGGTLLIFFRAPWITTVIGFLVGASLKNVEDITGIADALEKQHKGVQRIAAFLSEVLSATPPIEAGPIWVFFGLFVVMCLLAYRHE